MEGRKKVAGDENVGKGLFCYFNSSLFECNGKVIQTFFEKVSLKIKAHMRINRIIFTYDSVFLLFLHYKNANNNNNNIGDLNFQPSTG